MLISIIASNRPRASATPQLPCPLCVWCFAAVVAGISPSRLFCTPQCGPLDGRARSGSRRSTCFEWSACLARSSHHHEAAGVPCRAGHYGGAGALRLFPPPRCCRPQWSGRFSPRGRRDAGCVMLDDPPGACSTRSGPRPRSLMSSGIACPRGRVPRTGSRQLFTAQRCLMLTLSEGCPFLVAPVHGHQALLDEDGLMPGWRERSPKRRASIERALPPLGGLDVALRSALRVATGSSVGAAPWAAIVDARTMRALQSWCVLGVLLGVRSRCRRHHHEPDGPACAPVAARRGRRPFGNTNGHFLETPCRKVARRGRRHPAPALSPDGTEMPARPSTLHRPTGSAASS